MYWEPVEASLILELVQEINITWTLNASDTDFDMQHAPEEFVDPT